MRFYIVAIVIIGTASAAMCDDEKIFAEDIIKECAQQIGIAPGTLDLICAGDWTDHNTEAKVKYINDNRQPNQTKRLFIFRNYLGSVQMCIHEEWFYRRQWQFE